MFIFSLTLRQALRIVTMVPLVLSAQPIVKHTFNKSDDVLMQFPELEFTRIKGAPMLSKPILVTGTNKPILSEGHGLAAPAFWDWDGDGLKDLLIGEFGSGVEKGRYIGNFIRVYKNIGTETNPEFSGEFDYARPPYEILSNGTPYSVDQFCCLGFTPQFIDLNNDGKQDIITGGYHGEVSWFKGTEDGFMPGEALPQEGNPRDPIERRKKWHQFYWLYSSASFGDFTGDGKPDLIIGGRAMRVSNNMGTISEPHFATREILLTIYENPLTVYDLNADDMKLYEDRKFLGYEPPPSGDEDLSPYVVDWDNDGVLDILSTNSYSHKNLATVTFFKGVKTNDKYRFQPGISLFNVRETGKAFPGNGKAFPGSGPRISVVDWNSDGVNDLILGTSVVTSQGQVSKNLAWGWEKDLNIMPAGKDPSNLTELSGETLKRFKDTNKIPDGMTIEEFMTIRHRGYIYILLGSGEQQAPMVPAKAIKTKNNRK